MKRELRFIRLSERWFLDILWEGSVDDLEMVGNTNLLLSAYANNKLIVDTVVSTEPIDNFDIELTKSEVHIYGASYSAISDKYSGEVWICDVTRTIFGEFPKKFYVKFV